MCFIYHNEILSYRYYLDLLAIGSFYLNNHKTSTNFFIIIAVKIDRSCEELKQLGKEAWKEKYTYLKTKWLDDEEKYCICMKAKAKKIINYLNL